MDRMRNESGTSAKLYFVIGTEQEYENQRRSLQRAFPQEVLQLLYDRVKLYDEAYGANRNLQDDLGGFCIVIADEHKCTEVYRELFSKYGLQDELYEYQDRIECKDSAWIEALYIISSDYSIVLFYPDGNQEEEGL